MNKGRNFMICNGCREEINGKDHNIDGKHLCTKCFNKHYFYCTKCKKIEKRENVLCKKIEKRENVFAYNEHFLCNKCRDIFFWFCEGCQEYHTKSSSNLNFSSSKRKEFIYNDKLFCKTSLLLLGLKFCSRCNKFEKEDNMFVYNSCYYCQTCKQNFFFKCSYCENYHIGEGYKFNNKLICKNCINEKNLAYCSCCNFVDEKKHFILTRSSVFYHQKCFDEHFNSDQEKINIIINHYQYKPEPIFKGCSETEAITGEKMVFGFESEMYSGFEGAKYISENFNEFVYLKSDSSIVKSTKVNGGFEVVSHPMTLEFMKTNSKMIELFNFFEKNCTADDKTGIHIHLNKSSISNIMMIKLLYFFHNNCLRHTLTDIAGRDFIYNSYCDTYNISILNDIVRLLNSKITTINFYSKHKIINFVSEHTIEFRMFAGDTSKNAIINACEFIEKTIKFLEKFDLGQMKNEENLIAEEFQKYFFENK